MRIHGLIQDLQLQKLILYLAGRMLQLIQRKQIKGVIVFRYREGIFQEPLQPGLAQVQFWQGTYFPALQTQQAPDLSQHVSL